MQKRHSTLRALSHSYYNCKYHIVWTPKFRAKFFQDKRLRQEMRRIIRLVCKWKGFEILEGNIQHDHIHMVLIISPKHSIAYAMSIIKGKSSSWIKKKYKKLKVTCAKGSLWARGYYVSTIGLEEWQVRNYVKYQEKHNQIQNEQLRLLEL